MQREITFTQEPGFQTLGRNGYSRAKGLIAELNGDTLLLAPINSKGDIGRARLVCPIADVPALAAALSSMAPAATAPAPDYRQQLAVVNYQAAEAAYLIQNPNMKRFADAADYRVSWTMDILGVGGFVEAACKALATLKRTDPTEADSAVVFQVRPHGGTQYDESTVDLCDVFATADHYATTGQSLKNPVTPEPVRLPWYVIVNPDWYDEDEGDAGYAWGGEATDKADAINQALAACWSDNGRLHEDEDEDTRRVPTYDPDAHQQDGFTVYEASPDFVPLARDVSNARAAGDMQALAGALDRLDQAVQLDGHSR